MTKKKGITGVRLVLGVDRCPELKEMKLDKSSLLSPH